METILTVNGSSGYGFPFTLEHLNFYRSCKEAENKLDVLSGKIRMDNSMKLLNNTMKVIRRITKDHTIKEIADKLSDINMLFQKIRSAFKVPEKGNLSDDMKDDDLIHDQCNIIIGEMKVYLNVDIPTHIFIAAKHIVMKYHEREVMLFANNPEHSIPRTNNAMEIFFRKLNRNIRKRCGNIATKKILARSGVTLATFQNMANTKYIEIIFGKQDIASVFSKYRKPFKKPGMTKKKIMKLVEKATEMIVNDSLSDNAYNDELMDKAYALRNSIPM